MSKMCRGGYHIPSGYCRDYHKEDAKMSEEELRELLDKYIAPAWLQKRYKTTEVPSYDLHLDEAMRAIHSYTQEKCREARIDELDKLIGIEDKTFNRWSQKDIAHFFNTVGKRYRELQAQLNKSKGK